jgi:hypothetical protein
MAALRGDQDIATALVERNAIAYIRGKGYNISNMVCGFAVIGGN